MLTAWLTIYNTASPLSAVQVVMEKDGKVIIKTPDGRLIVQEDRAKGQVSVRANPMAIAAFFAAVCKGCMLPTCLGP